MIVIERFSSGYELVSVALPSRLLVVVDAL